MPRLVSSTRVGTSFAALTTCIDDKPVNIGSRGTTSPAESGLVLLGPWLVLLRKEAVMRKKLPRPHSMLGIAAGALAALTLGCQRERGADDGARLAPPDTELPSRAAPPDVAVAPRPDSAEPEGGALRLAAEALPRTVARATLAPT